MDPLMSRIPAIVLAAAALVSAAAANAAQRTFVASNGNDANNCSLQAPCRSFGTAITQTDPNGEIIVLDSAGYGRVTVDKSVTIAAPPGIYGGLSVFSGTNGVDIATPGVTVVLRGLTINGQGGTHGISMAAGSKLVIESCVIANMAMNGLQVASTGANVTVKDSIFRDNGANGVAAIVPGAKVGLDNVRSEANGQAGLLLDNGATGTMSRGRLDGNVNGARVLSSNGSAITILSLSDSVASGNSNRGVDAFAAAGPGFVRAYLTNATLSSNGNAGVVADAGAGGRALVSVTMSTVSGNGTGVLAANGSAPGDVTLAITASSVSRNTGAGLAQSGAALLKTRQDNTVHDNSPDQSGTLTPIAPL
jgi:hypothetical protein